MLFANDINVKQNREKREIERKQERSVRDYKREAASLFSFKYEVFDPLTSLTIYRGLGALIRSM